MFIDHTLYVDSTWEFLRLILDLSMKVLKQDGKYFTQVWYLDVKKYCCISIVIYIFQMHLFLFVCFLRKSPAKLTKYSSKLFSFLIVLCLDFCMKFGLSKLTCLFPFSTEIVCAFELKNIISIIRKAYWIILQLPAILGKAEQVYFTKIDVVFKLMSSVIQCKTWKFVLSIKM